MSHKPGTYLGGIRTLEDLRQRCYVDPDTGCWHWRMYSLGGKACVFYRLPDGTVRKATARRAAKELTAGAKLPSGVKAYPTLKCSTRDCGNPKHSLLGSQKDVAQRALDAGRRSAEKHRIGTTLAARERAKLNLDIARQIRQSELPNGEEARKWGVGATTVSAVRNNLIWREDHFTCLVPTLRERARRVA